MIIFKILLFGFLFSLFSSAITKISFLCFVAEKPFAFYAIMPLFAGAIWFFSWLAGDPLHFPSWLSFFLTVSAFVENESVKILFSSENMAKFQKGYYIFAICSIFCYIFLNATIVQPIK